MKTIKLILIFVLFISFFHSETHAQIIGATNSLWEISQGTTVTTVSDNNDCQNNASEPFDPMNIFGADDSTCPAEPLILFLQTAIPMALSTTLNGKPPALSPSDRSTSMRKGTGRALRTTHDNFPASPSKLNLLGHQPLISFCSRLRHLFPTHSFQIRMGGLC